ncbi:MAG: NosR/NirI family protein [Gammaproteobacteria bacterium]|nr:NosR/NirI family protein [Gammaproteobacteria bacterium]MCW8988709.1 NosR/NirI family protein [Gammaproteobacteria bacterium]
MNRNNHPSDFKHHTQYFLLRVLNILFLRLYNSLRQLGLVTVYLVFLFFSFNYNVNAGLLTKLDPVSEATPYALTFFPFADSLGTFDGDPESAAVYSDNKLVGYVFFTDHVMPIPGYSGKPMHTLVGFDLTGKITGIEIVSHEEPILLAGVSEQDLLDFKNQYLGFNANQRSQVGGSEREGYVTFDGITGATITAMVLNSTITTALREIAILRGLIKPEENTVISAEEPIWVYAWRNKIFQIIVLSAGLLILFLILIFQDWLAHHPSFLIYLRYGFLIYTVIFIGWYSLAQLSIVNVLTFVSSIMHGFSWDTFMIDPMLFILWSFVAMTILLWGRGVYCGWLCPFGASQEIVYKIGEKLGVRSFEFPAYVHERLWAIKYLVMLGLFGLSLQSLARAEVVAEVEPFKTVFSLHFHREWGYVLYATALILVSALNRKFYCRYICPLGAALTFPSKFKIFDWLRRRKECGRPCQTCRAECEVGAIRLTGEIISQECHYCLDCQVTYWNDKKCPPLAERRKRIERRQAINKQASINNNSN